jgi:hypothetical protein
MKVELIQLPEDEAHQVGRRVAKGRDRYGQITPLQVVRNGPCGALGVQQIFAK